jgi:hypothetical protein
VKDIEVRLETLEKGFKVLEGGTQKHSLAWTKQKTLLKSRVAALENGMGERPASATPLADVA